MRSSLQSRYGVSLQMSCWFVRHADLVVLAGIETEDLAIGTIPQTAEEFRAFG